MNIDAEAVALVRAATRPPKRQRRERLCKFAGPFCGSCPDVDDVPCVREAMKPKGKARDCDTCTASGCPCMIGWTVERRAAYSKWKKRHDAANAKTRERRRQYGHRRWYKNAWRDMSKAYSQGRACAGADCDEPITNANKSGFCKRCAALRRGKGGLK